MNTILWIVQGLLAVVFLMAGGMKVARSKAELVEAGQDWVESVPDWVPRVIGVLEILGAIGLIVPALTGIAPILTPIAAAGLVLTMIGAAIVHIQRNEAVPYLVINSVLGLTAAFIVYGRFVAAPFV